MRRRAFVWSVAVLSLAVTVAAGPRARGNEGSAGGSSAGDVSYAHIELKGSYPEGAQLPGLFSDLSETLDKAVARLDAAAADDKVSGVILRVNEPDLGWARMRAFRDAIGRVRAKGKKVHAYLDGGSNMDYLLATACDEIVMPEVGMLMTVGVRTEVTFYKRLFDLIGVKFEALRVGEYKSAAEPYSRTEMSPEFRKEMEEILDDYWQQLVDTIAESRKLPREKVTAAIDAAPLTARQAKELGLIDRLGYEDDLEAALTKQAAGKSFKIARKYGRKKSQANANPMLAMMEVMNALMGVEQPKRKTSTPKVAVIFASGMIMTGKSKADLLGASIMGSDTMVAAIREARNDSSVKAVVLRVDSPGGSALASDLMWHELELVKAAKKPFVVSMGDVAGSGGYYISMGADRIFADPGTITGSIGVVGGKFAVGGLFGKVGINTEVISRGKNAGVLSMASGFSESERQAMQKMLNEIYEVFTTKAAQGRKMERDKLEQLARGRVYTGSAAKKLGLIDELGSLEDAIAAARKMAGMDPDDKVERLVLPKPVSPLESLFGSLEAEAETGAAGAAARRLLASVSPELAKNLHMLSLLKILARERVLAVMPFQMIVK